MSTDAGEELPPSVEVEPEPMTAEEAFVAMVQKAGDPGGYHLEVSWWTKGKGRVKLSCHVETHTEILNELFALRGVLVDFEAVGG